MPCDIKREGIQISAETRREKARENEYIQDPSCHRDQDALHAGESPRVERWNPPAETAALHEGSSEDSILGSVDIQICRLCSM